jgi:hypothetical protein
MQNSNHQNVFLRSDCLGFRALVIWICFVLRISDFEINEVSVWFRPVHVRL